VVIHLNSGRVAGGYRKRKDAGDKVPEFGERGIRKARKHSKRKLLRISRGGWQVMGGAGRMETDGMTGKSEQEAAFLGLQSKLRPTVACALSTPAGYPSLVVGRPYGESPWKKPDTERSNK